MSPDTRSDTRELHDLDDVDRQIIALLRRNGRATNQDIARSLNMPVLDRKSVV